VQDTSFNIGELIFVEQQIKAIPCQPIITNDRPE
jgi:hypothetical protein